MNRKNEIWKKVNFADGRYEISNLGRLKNTKSRFNNGLSYFTLKVRDGYYKVSLKLGSERLRISIHRLVAIAFIPNPENKRTVNHKDGNKLNNSVDNLEWATDKENTVHAWNLGLIPNGKKEVIDMETGLVYESMKQVCLSFNIPRSSLFYQINGGYKNTTKFKLI